MCRARAQYLTERNGKGVNKYTTPAPEIPLELESFHPPVLWIHAGITKFGHGCPVHVVVARPASAAAWKAGRAVNTRVVVLSRTPCTPVECLIRHAVLGGDGPWMKHMYP
ncbi:hypothetical protein SRHO_G00274730 [Serrasalmus rhombeus]